MDISLWEGLLVAELSVIRVPLLLIGILKEGIPCLATKAQNPKPPFHFGTQIWASPRKGEPLSFRIPSSSQKTILRSILQIRWISAWRLRPLLVPER